MSKVKLVGALQFMGGFINLWGYKHTLHSFTRTSNDK